MKEPYKYYRFGHPSFGTRYFRVKKDEQVLQVVTHVNGDKRSNRKIGVQYIKYASWVSNDGWHVNHSNRCKEISPERFYKILGVMISKFYHWQPIA